MKIAYAIIIFFYLGFKKQLSITFKKNTTTILRPSTLQRIVRVAHEFLHALNLAHSFANSEASKHAEFTYQYAKTENLLDYTHRLPGHSNDRCSLWYWQWTKANNSIK